MKLRILSAVLVLLLAASLAQGCSDKKGGDDTVNTSTTAITDNSSTPVNTDSVSGSTGGSGDMSDTDHSHENDSHTTNEEEELIKAEYTVSGDHAQKLSEENTEKPIKYAGFTSKYYNTPVKEGKTAKSSYTFIYSRTAFTNYISDNKDTYDLGMGSDSFTGETEKYNEQFFNDKSLILVSLSDDNGGSNYQITGAWDEHIHYEDSQLDLLVFAMKRTPGNNHTGHVIIEIDNKFLNLWDNFSVSTYE